MNKDKKHKGFNVPEGYFEKFEESLELRLMEEALPKSNGFKVPEGYFDTLEVKVMSSVTTRDSKVVSIFKNRTMYYVAGIAASLLLIFTLTTRTERVENLADISLSEVESYLAEYENDYDTYDIMALMEEDDYNEITLDSDVISEESLEDYLFENIEETSSLLIE